jgi:hypothetical protein
MVQGIEDTDDSIVKALMSFILHMAAGDSSAAVSAMRSVRGSAAWSIMARVAVRSRRADILSLCLNHMEKMPAAQAFRTARSRARRRHGASRRARRSVADEDDEKNAACLAAAEAKSEDFAALGLAAAQMEMREEAIEILREGECWWELVDVLQV